MLHNFVNAVLMFVLVNFLLPLMSPLPKATLAAIIIVALVKLVNFGGAKRLFLVKTGDALLWVVTFVSTALLGVMFGIMIGIISGLVVLVQRSTALNVVETGRLPGTTIYRALTRFPDAQRLVQQAEEAWHVGFAALRRTTPTSHLECATLYLSKSWIQSGAIATESRAEIKAHGAHRRFS